jgi:quercetin dioxygenase-like cupin family protein
MSLPKHLFVSRRGFLAAMAATSAAVGASAFGLTPSISVAAGAPAGISTSFETWFDVNDRPGVPFEIVQIVVDFPTGARAARHVNSGPGHITVLDGEVTMWIGAQSAHTYAAGASFVEPFPLVVEAANSSPTPASLLLTYLVPAGSAVSMPAEGAPAPPDSQRPPGPIARFQSRMRIDEELPHSQVGHVLLTYQPGARTAPDEPRTAQVLTVVSGEVTVLSGATQQTYTPGQHWIESPGQAWLSENRGSSPAVVAVSTTRAAEPSQMIAPQAATVAPQAADALAARLTRTEVQRSASSIPGREIVQVLTQIPAGVESGWHTHPGEEVGYILAGTVEMSVRGQPTRTLHAGDGFLIPPQTQHNAFDVGPETGQMLSTYIVESGQPLATLTG